MLESGVYKIQSISHPERCYIGSAVKFKRRKRDHFYKLSKNKHDSPKLQNHYNKYGKDDLVFSVLIECPREKVVIKEQCFMNIYKPWFNISPTATSSQGIRRSDEFRRKVSEIKSGVALSEIHKARIGKAQEGENNSFFWKHHSEESNDKRRQWNIDNNIKPPSYHGGRKKGSKNKPKT